MSLPEVAEIRRWRIEPGDRLIVSVEQQISPQQVDVIKAKVRASLALPDNFPILVTGPGITVEVAQSDEDRIRSAMAEAAEHPGRIVTR